MDITFKRAIIKRKWYGTYNVFKNGEKTGIVIYQHETEIGILFVCMVDPESEYYNLFHPVTVETLKSAQTYITKFFHDKYAMADCSGKPNY